MVDSICLAKQADLEAVAFSGTGRRLARAAIGLGAEGLRPEAKKVLVRDFKLNVGAKKNA